ncbi:cytochrome-c peroxidase [Beggiatoa sp. PS]|nr:cytochrome-c peroxidase [Beggiatoa sp. PS]
MHDGSIATLEEVIDHYARGGRLITEGPLAGDGAKNPFKSELLVGFTITDEEKNDIINFLNSLTDWSFICDERFSDPFGNLLPHSNCL